MDNLDVYMYFGPPTEFRHFDNKSLLVMLRYLCAVFIREKGECASFLEIFGNVRSVRLGPRKGKFTGIGITEKDQLVVYVVFPGPECEAELLPVESLTREELLRLARKMYQLTEMLVDEQILVCLNTYQEHGMEIVDIVFNMEFCSEPDIDFLKNASYTHTLWLLKNETIRFNGKKYISTGAARQLQLQVREPGSRKIIEIDLLMMEKAELEKMVRTIRERIPKSYYESYMTNLYELKEPIITFA